MSFTARPSYPIIAALAALKSAQSEQTKEEAAA